MLEGHWSGEISCNSLLLANIVIQFSAPCGLRGCKNGPAPFPGRMSYKATKPGLVSVLYLSMFFIVLVFPLFMYCSFSLYVFCLLVVLVKLSLLAKLLARKTPLSSESSPLQFLALA